MYRRYCYSFFVQESSWKRTNPQITGAILPVTVRFRNQWLYRRHYLAYKGGNRGLFPESAIWTGEGKVMKKCFIWCFLLGLLVSPLNSHAARSFYSNGNVDNSSGTPNRDLVFRDFDITPDGYITGYLMNQSSHALKSVRLDVWTTNKAETRVYWRKSLNIGDMAPNARYQVREPYSPLPDNPNDIVYKFRLPGNTNFRNVK